MRYKAVIFDMDGTVIDSQKCIFNAIRYVQKEMRLPELSRDGMTSFLGPSVVDSYNGNFDLSGEELDRAVFLHKKYTSTIGIDDYVLYPGITDLLNILSSQGVILSVASMKPQEVLDVLCSHYQLPFSIVCGYKDGKNKASLIHECIRTAEVEVEETVMVGDMESDKAGAEANDIDFIGVAYGYGFDGDGGYARTPMEVLQYLD